MIDRVKHCIGRNISIYKDEKTEEEDLRPHIDILVKTFRRLAKKDLSLLDIAALLPFLVLGCFKEVGDWLSCSYNR